MESFNLCDEPWIPIAGECKKRSLTEIFGDPHCPELSGNAVDKTVILRFLLCIVHASTKIADDDAWQALTIEQISKNALAYLKKWHDRFDLYGEKPFLQFPALAKKGGNPTSPGALQVNVADGNKVVLTTWNRFQPLTEAEKAILLLRSSCYACGGKKYDNSLLLSPGVEKGKTGRCGTLLGMYGYLHSYFLGESLVDTLHLNLLTQNDIESIGAFPDGIGKPFWENMPSGESGSRTEEYFKSYLGHLFPIDKFLLLQDDGIIKTDGIPYPGHKDGVTDPAITIYTQGKDIKAIWTRAERRAWRELPSILSFFEAKNNRRPYLLAMGWHKIKHSTSRFIRIWTGGVEVSFNSGEQYLSGKNDYLESIFSFPVELDETVWMTRFKNLLTKMDIFSKMLYGAVNGYYKNLQSDLAANMAADACQKFWNQMGKDSQLFIELANMPEESDDVMLQEKRWFGLLCDLYDQQCPHDTPRQITAWVSAAPGKKKK